MNRLGNLGLLLIACALLVGGLAGAAVAHHFDTLPSSAGAGDQAANHRSQHNQGHKDHHGDHKHSGRAHHGDTGSGSTAND
jgi:hypothetical protein